MNKNQINRKMTISKALKINKNTGKILTNSGLHCMGCWISDSETIEEGCLIHGISEKEIDLIVNKINHLK